MTSRDTATNATNQSNSLIPKAKDPQDEPKSESTSPKLSSNQSSSSAGTELKQHGVALATEKTSNADKLLNTAGTIGSQTGGHSLEPLSSMEQLSIQKTISEPENGLPSESLNSINNNGSKIEDYDSELPLENCEALSRRHPSTSLAECTKCSGCGEKMYAVCTCCQIDELNEEFHHIRNDGKWGSYDKRLQIQNLQKHTEEYAHMRLQTDWYRAVTPKMSDVTNSIKSLEMMTMLERKPPSVETGMMQLACFQLVMALYEDFQTSAELGNKESEAGLDDIYKECTKKDMRGVKAISCDPKKKIHSALVRRIYSTTENNSGIETFPKILCKMLEENVGAILAKVNLERYKRSDVTFRLICRDINISQCLPLSIKPQPQSCTIYLMNLKTGSFSATYCVATMLDNGGKCCEIQCMESKDYENIKKQALTEGCAIVFATLLHPCASCATTILEKRHLLDTPQSMVVYRYAHHESESAQITFGSRLGIPVIRLVGNFAVFENRKALFGSVTVSLAEFLQKLAAPAQQYIAIDGDADSSSDDGISFDFMSSSSGSVSPNSDNDLTCEDFNQKYGNQLPDRCDNNASDSDDGIVFPP